MWSTEQRGGSPQRRETLTAFRNYSLRFLQKERSLHSTGRALTESYRLGSPSPLPRNTEEQNKRAFALFIVFFSCFLPLSLFPFCTISALQTPRPPTPSVFLSDKGTVQTEETKRKLSLLLSGTEDIQKTEQTRKREVGLFSYRENGLPSSLAETLLRRRHAGIEARQANEAEKKKKKITSSSVREDEAKEQRKRAQEEYSLWKRGKTERV